MLEGREEGNFLLGGMGELAPHWTGHIREKVLKKRGSSGQTRKDRGLRGAAKATQIGS